MQKFNKFLGHIVEQSQNNAGELDEIILLLNFILEDEWIQNVDLINQHPEIIHFANYVVRISCVANIKNENILKLIILLLQNNNILFHRKYSYKDYQFLSCEANKLIKCMKDELSDHILVDYYIHAIYSDWIFEASQIKEEFEENMLFLYPYIEKLSDIKKKFLASLNIAQFYFFKANKTKVHLFMKKARLFLKQINEPNYRALFLYYYTWFSLEFAELNRLKKLEPHLIKLIQSKELKGALPLHCLNICSSMKFKLDKFKESIFYSIKCYRLAKKFYGSELEDVIAESLLIIARCLEKRQSFKKAIFYTRKAISILIKVFGAEDIDLSQAAAHIFLGQLYFLDAQYENAREEYIFAENLLLKNYPDNLMNLSEATTLYDNMKSLAKVTKQNYAENLK